MKKLLFRHSSYSEEGYYKSIIIGCLLHTTKLAPLV